MSFNLSNILSSLYSIKVLAGSRQSHFPLILDLNLVSTSGIRLFNFLDISYKIIEKHKICGVSLIFEFLFWNNFAFLIKLQIVPKDSQSRESSLVIVFLLAIILCPNNSFELILKLLIIEFALNTDKTIIVLVK